MPESAAIVARRDGAVPAIHEAIAPAELAAPTMAAAAPVSPPTSRVAAIAVPANQARPIGTMANAALLREVFQPDAPGLTPGLAQPFEPAPRSRLPDTPAPIVASAARRHTRHVGEFALLAELSGLSIPVPPAQPGSISVARTGIVPAVPLNPPERRPARSVASQVLAIARVAGAKDL